MRPAERDGVRAMLTEAYQQYAKVMPPEVFERYLESVLDTGEGHQLVAVDGDRILGGARLYLPGSATVRLPPDWAWVRAVGVAPAARGTGVAREIMAHCAENTGGATTLALHTLDFMRAAIRLYELLGYERAPEYDFPAGRGAFTAIAYRLPLR
jgi:GNAT superfamily N-acetyltransferase